MDNLTAYATRLLLGTGLTPAAASAVASGITPASTPVEHALRDGWTATDRAVLAPPAPDEDTEGQP